MRNQKTNLYNGALQELMGVFDKLDNSAVDHAVQMIADANNVVVFGGGRERLQIMGFAMRLYHMGQKIAVEGDMTIPLSVRAIYLLLPLVPAKYPPHLPCWALLRKPAQPSWS